MAKQNCQKCKGEGEIICQGCSGIAKVYKNSRLEKGGAFEKETREWSACAKCHGRGVVTCPECKGTGSV